MAEKASLIIEVVENGVRKASINLKDLTRASEQAERTTIDFSRSLSETDSNARRAGISLAALSKIAATYLSYEAVKRATAIADSMTNMRTQIQLVTSTQQEAILVQDELFNISLRTYSSLEATSTLYSRTARALKDAGKDQSDFLKFTEAINNAMRIGGANATEQASALLQLSQAMGSGVLQGDEFRSIAENAPILLDLVAKELGVVRGEVKALASEGKITSDVIFNALTKSADQLAQDASRVTVTVGAATENLRSSLFKYADEMLNSTGVTAGFANIINMLGNNIEVVGGVVGSLAAGAIAAYVAKVTMATGATLAQALASIKAADAARIQASQELALAVANERQARMAALAATANASLGGSHARATQLTMAHVAAQHRLAQAHANTVSVTGGVLKMLGGPVGLIGLVASAATMFTLFSDDVNKAKVSIDEIIEPIGAVMDKITKMDRLEKEVFLKRTKDQYLSSVEAAKQGYEELTQSINRALYSVHGLNQARGFEVWVRGELEAAAESGEDLILVIDRIVAKTGVSRDKIIEKAGALGGLTEKVNSYKNILDAATEMEEKSLEIAKAKANIYDPAASIMKGNDPQLSEQASKIMKDLEKSYISLNNLSELQVLELAKANGQLEELKEGEYELLELRARSNDELRKTIGNQSGIKSIVDGINRQHATIGMTAAQAQIFDLEAMGADPKVVEDMKKKLTEIGSHSFGATSLDHYSDRLRDMSSELSKILAINNQLETHGFASQYNAVAQLTNELNDQASTLYGISSAQKQVLITQAQQIDAANQLNAIMSLGTDYTKRIEDLAFENELMGKSAQQIEAMRFAYELEQQAKLLSIGMSKENIAILEEEIQKYLELYDLVQKARGEKENSIGGGIQDGMQRYVDSVGNMRDQFADATMSTLGHMENFLFDFATTGKANFRDMTVSILQDISKMMIRMAMMQAVQSAMGMFSGGGLVGNSGRAVSYPYQAWTGGHIPEYATGGKVIDFSGGGFTGDGGKFEPKGIVHGGEFVMSKAAVNTLGIGYLEQLHNSAKSGAKGYANGGIVGNTPTIPSFPKSKSPQVNSEPINIHVVVNTEDGTVETNDNEISARLKRDVEVIVDRHMTKNKRPGGGLR